MRWDRLRREMNFLEIAESDTWDEEAFLVFWNIKQINQCPFFPLSIFSLIESNTPLRNILLIYMSVDIEQKILQPFPSPQKDLHNFESVFITVFIYDCPKAELKLTITAS